MAKQNKLTFEGRVLGDVKSKTFGSGKQVHEWLMGVGAKDAQGQWKNGIISVKKWGETAPTKGQDIIIEGRLGAEVWSKDGVDKSKVLIVCESFTAVGNDHNDHQDARALHNEQKANGYQQQPQDDDSQLPF